MTTDHLFLSHKNLKGVCGARRQDHLTRLINSDHLQRCLSCAKKA